MKIRLVLALMLVLALLVGCTPPATPPGPTATPAPPLPVDTSQRGGFAPYVPVKVDVALAAPAYVPDLSAGTNQAFASYWLVPAAQAVLQENGFVVVPRPYKQIYEIYELADEQSYPAFVTTDSVLHAYHVLYDYALRLVETEHLLGDLEALNAALLEAAQRDYDATSGPLQEAAWQNLAFLSVAAKLLDADYKPSAPVRDAVRKELALIEAHAGFEASPIFDRYRTVDGEPTCKFDYCEDYWFYSP